jgi:hypothetical protein
VVLDYDFCSITFEIDEDELPVHSVNCLIQKSGKNDAYISDTVQNNDKNEKNEDKSDSIGEEPILNEPYTYDDAIKAPDADEWIKAMEFELNALDKMRIWEVTQAPANTNIVGSKWVYHYKYNPSYHIIKRRALSGDTPHFLFLYFL